MNKCPKIVIVMGVSGCGKSTVGLALANSLGWQFKDADDYHCLSNKEKMNQGIALTDIDRIPWLESLRIEIEFWISKDKPTILACSSLKHSYRQILSSHLPQVQFIYLKLNEQALQRRLELRKHEFMNPSLLESQFRTLEEPIDAITVNADSSVSELIRAIEKHLGIEPIS